MRKKINVLIVEDNFDHFYLIDYSFKNRSNQYTLTHVTTIENAIIQIKTNPPDIIISDLILPDGEGICLINNTNTIDIIPIVLMTSFGNEEYAVRAIKMGALDYLVKSPEMFNDLPNLVNKFLDNWYIKKSLKEKDKEIAKANDRLNNIFNRSPFAIFELDHEFNIVYYNKTLFNIFKLNNNTEIAFNTLFFDQSKETIIKHVQNVFKTREYLQFECTLTNLHGCEFFARVEILPLTYENTKNLLIIITDITEKKRIDEFHIKENKLHSIGHLAAGMAHGFNNILSAIMGNINLSKLSLSSNSNIYKYLEEAENACDKAKQLSNQLLTFSSGGSPMKRRINIKDLIIEASTLAVIGSNVTCNFEFDPNLHLVMVDHDQIFQAIQNIVINAKQAMNDDGVVYIKAYNYYPTDDALLPLGDINYIRISIEDNGHGISEENQKYIFDPYYTTKGMANGLGLTTSYSIFKQHNGFIDVESKVNIGTTFYITIPSEGKTNRINKKAYNDNISSVNNKTNILVLNEDETECIMIKRLLLHLRFDVDCTSIKDDLINKFKASIYSQKPYDILIADLFIIETNEENNIIDRLRIINPNIHVILLSSVPDDPVVLNYRNFGFDAVLIKPFSIDELNSKINQFLTPQ
ncbi:MAG TPA: response regulator [Candidatus Cloacimonadota bacterium]|nr:response regulator [Candidatus Cloacimonadota bacterium]HQB40219.1 response regulator [Candidatus Cloacimonadota bacterium]